jgi:putative ABC transport system permease protein
MYAFWQDVLFALRLLRKSPGFALAAIFTLALGMSINTVMFSILNTVLLRALPYPQSDQLVRIWETDRSQGDEHSPISPYDFLEWQRHTQSFSGIATYRYSSLVLTGHKTPMRISAEFVSAGFFDLFQVNPAKGRTFRPDEDNPGTDHVVVLGDGAWSRYFDRDPDIIGKSITLDDQSYTVIGVMPADFSFPNDSIEAWCLPGFDSKTVSRNKHFLSSMGRLKPGISLQRAQAEMDGIAENLNRLDGRANGVRLVTLWEQIVGNVRRRLLVLWMAVLAVLLVACANVAGLLLARAVARQKEVAIRTALGGSRVRLVRQFLTESILLATLGGCLGVVLSYGAGHFLIASANGSIPRLRALHMDGLVLGFTAFACIVTGVAFGIAPAMHASRFNLYHSLKENMAVPRGTGTFNLRTVFVVVEIAFAMALLISSGLLTKTLWKLQQVNPGFQTDNVVSFRFSVRNGKYGPLQLTDLYGRLLERLATLPGVESVGAINDLPFSGSRSGQSFEVEGLTFPAGETPESDYRTVSPYYMQTMRIRLVAGREFTEDDNRQAPYVAIVNEAFVKKFFLGRGPLDQRLKVKDQRYRIVGIIGNVKHEDLAVAGDPEIYVPYAQAGPVNSTFIVVRSKVDLKTMSAAVRNAVQDIAPDEPIQGLNTMTHLVESWMAPQKFSSLLLAVFAGLSLALTVIGIYGVIAYTVAQRTREIGIRMALGADRGNILRLMLRQGFRIGMLGVAGGGGISWLATRILSNMLFGVAPHDPAIFLGVAAILFLVVILATYFPARKGTEVDPVMALR